MHDFCGLDFGTSNSTIGVYKENHIQMVPLEQGKPTLRSAIFFDSDSGKHLFGQSAVDDYLSGAHGRLMMSLKSILGSSLMKEQTVIAGRPIPYTQILGKLLKYIKTKAEHYLGHELNKVVLGRPVRFHDYDEKKDRIAQDTLEEVARQQGFETILFQYEPIAAALAYEQSITKEKLALIIDLGGGTSDFSVIHLKPYAKNSSISKAGIRSNDNNRIQDVLANKGIHIGGTDFDTRFSLETIMPELGLGGGMQGLSGTLQIPSSYYHDLTTWHTINSLYNHQTKRHLKEIYHFALKKHPIKRLMHVIESQQGHKILNVVEQGKCQLSAAEKIELNLNFIETDFLLPVTRETFQESIQDKVEQLIQTVLSTIAEAGVKEHQINSVFFTGGSTQIPLIRQAIESLFSSAEFVKGDVFSSVGKGLIIDARRRYLDA